MSSQKDFTVAILGGGLVGLVCAIGLANAGVDVDVFEAASKYGEMGAGINVGHSALRVFEAMGILNDVTENQGPRLPHMSFVRGEDPHNLVYLNNDGNWKDHGLGVHRAAFLKGLERLLPSNVRSHFKKRCVDVVSAADGRAEVQFADGATHVADVIIGADGIKSVVRGQVLGEKGDRVVDTGGRIYRTLLPYQRLLDAGINEEALSPRNWVGKNKHLITYRIGDGTMFNFAAVARDLSQVMAPAGPQASWDAWVEPSTRAEILSQYEDYGPDARAIMGCIETATKWKVHALYPPLESYVAAAPAREEGKGEEKAKLNVVLIGDAAHAMAPWLGSGASAGIEDAHILSSLLAHPQTRRENLPDVLRAYDSVHVPRATYIANHSLYAGSVYWGHGKSGDSDTGRRRDLDKIWEPVWDHDTRTEVAKAVGQLVDQGTFQSNA